MILLTYAEILCLGGDPIGADQDCLGAKGTYSVRGQAPKAKIERKDACLY